MPEPMDFAEAHRAWRCTACGARRGLIAYAWPATTAGLHKPLTLTCWAEGTDQPHTWTGANTRLL